MAWILRFSLSPSTSPHPWSLFLAEFLWECSHLSPWGSWLGVSLGLSMPRSFVYSLSPWPPCQGDLGRAGGPGHGRFLFQERFPWAKSTRETHPEFGISIQTAPGEGEPRAGVALVTIPGWGGPGDNPSWCPWVLWLQAGLIPTRNPQKAEKQLRGMSVLCCASSSSPPAPLPLAFCGLPGHFFLLALDLSALKIVAHK